MSLVVHFFGTQCTSYEMHEKRMRGLVTQDMN